MMSAITLLKPTLFRDKPPNRDSAADNSHGVCLKFGYKIMADAIRSLTILLGIFSLFLVVLRQARTQGLSYDQKVSFARIASELATVV